MRYRAATTKAPLWLVTVAGALLLIGGLGWGITGYAAEQPWTGRSATALVGTWQVDRDHTLELRSDHTFTAHGLSGYSPGTNALFS